MDILSGTFGAGRGIVGGRGVEIQPRAIFSTRAVISFSDISSVEPLGGHSQKKLGETAGFGAAGVAVGSVLGGPIGMLAGGALGALAGGRKDYVTFSCHLTDGRHFVAKATVVEYAELQNSTIRGETRSQPKELELRRARSTKAEANKRRSVQKSANRKSPAKASELQPLPGRDNSVPPTPEAPLYASLSRHVQESSESAEQLGTVSGALEYAEYLHLIKWRYFDELMDDLDVVHAILLKLIVAEQLASVHEGEKNYRQTAVENIGKSIAESHSELLALRAHEKRWGKLLSQPSAPLAERINELEQDRLSAEAKVREAEVDLQRCRVQADYLLSRFRELLSTELLTHFRSHYFDLVNVEFNGVEGWAIGTPWAIRHLKYFRPDLVRRQSKIAIDQSVAAESTRTDEPAANPNGDSGASPKERLKLLKELLGEGLVSEEEYDARRKAILDGI